MSIENRLLRLETKIAENQAGTTMIFLSFWETGPDGPRQVDVSGWGIGHDGEIISRQQDETEAALLQRAEAAALATGKGPYLMIQKTT